MWCFVSWVSSWYVSPYRVGAWVPVVALHYFEVLSSSLIHTFWIPLFEHFGYIRVCFRFWRDFHFPRPLLFCVLPLVCFKQKWTFSSIVSGAHPLFLVRSWLQISNHILNKSLYRSFLPPLMFFYRFFRVCSFLFFLHFMVTRGVC